MRGRTPMSRAEDGDLRLMFSCLPGARTQCDSTRVFHSERVGSLAVSDSCFTIYELVYRDHRNEDFRSKLPELKSVDQGGRSKLVGLVRPGCCEAVRASSFPNLSEVVQFPLCCYWGFFMLAESTVRNV